MVLLFWCRLTQVFVEKRPLNECSSSSSSSNSSRRGGLKSGKESGRPELWVGWRVHLSSGDDCVDHLTRCRRRRSACIYRCWSVRLCSRRSLMNSRHSMVWVSPTFLLLLTGVVCSVACVKLSALAHLLAVASLLLPDHNCQHTSVSLFWHCAIFTGNWRCFS